MEWLLGLPCLFHLLTGLYCPGCGGTRAVYYLLHGQLVTSLQFHPLVLYMAVVFPLEIGSWLLSRWRKKPELYIGHEKWFLVTGIAIALVNLIVKNYYLIIKGIDLLA